MALVTGFAHKYRDDSLLRTEVNIIALQLGYSVFVVALSVLALFVLYHEVVSGVTSAIIVGLGSGSGLSASQVTEQLEAVRTREVVGVAAVILATAAIFGYLVTRFALAPARNALAAQKRFIGNIAHELRTPLSVIRTNTEVRLFDADVSKEALGLHRSNLEELDRISSLINNLLTLNALLTPEQMSFNNVDIGKIARRAIDSFAGLARAKKLQVTLSVAREHTAWGNAAALEQIVLNLVKNAIQHTQQGEVAVTVVPAAGGALELVVADTGSGITQDDLARIFEPFFRGDRARTRSGGTGSGLGLAIVNELVHLHHGRIRVQSAVNTGTRVTVTLPHGHSVHERGRPVSTLRLNTPGETSVDFSRRQRERLRR